MRLPRALAALILIFVIAVSFASLIQNWKSATFQIMASESSPKWAILGSTCQLLMPPTFTHQLPTLLTSFILDIKIAARPPSVFNNSTRVAIYDFIKANPGVQFRGICNQLGLSIGLAEFHLGVLKKAGLISFIRDGRYKRFFEAKMFSKKEMEIISLLRHDTSRSIIKTMLEGKKVSHSELASQLSITSQGLTWQMNRLKKDGVVQESKDSVKVIYSVEEAYAPMLTKIINLLEQC